MRGGRKDASHQDGHARRNRDPQSVRIGGDSRDSNPASGLQTGFAAGHFLEGNGEREWPSIKETTNDTTARSPESSGDSRSFRGIRFRTFSKVSFSWRSSSRVLF